MTAITSIAFDHQQYLGSTLGDIAGGEGRHHQAGRSRGRRRARRGGVRRHRTASPASAARRSIRAADGVTTVTPAGPRRDDSASARPSAITATSRSVCAGAHQIGNAVVAVRILELLDARGISRAARRPSCQRSPGRPGRADSICGDWPDGREILLDAAHNPAGAAALASYLRGSRIGEPLPLVFAAHARQGRREHAARAAPGRRSAGRHPRLESPIGGSRGARGARAPRSTRTDRSRSRPRPSEALEIAWQHLAAHRRRRIDLSCSAT